MNQQNQPIELTLKEKIWQGIVSLEPAQNALAWMFQALAIVAIPFLFFCAIYIALQVTMPDITDKLTSLNNASLVIMNSAIEAALIGCFEMARQARRANDEHKSKITGRMGWLFLGLTVITLCYKVFNIDASYDKYLLLARCVAGIGYCLVVHPERKSKDNRFVRSVAIGERIDQLQKVTDQRLQSIENTVSLLVNNVQKTASDLYTRLESVHTQQVDDVHKLQEYVHGLCTQQADDVHRSLADLCTRIEGLYISQESDVQPTQFVNMDQFEQLASVVYNLSGMITQMSTSVTEVHTSVKHIAQLAPAPMPVVNASSRSARSLREQVAMPSQKNTDVIPVIEVPDVAPEKVQQVLYAVLVDGIGWSELQGKGYGNYSRTLRPIRVAYDLYIQNNVQS